MIQTVEQRLRRIEPQLDSQRHPGGLGVHPCLAKGGNQSFIGKQHLRKVPAIGYWIGRQLPEHRKIKADPRRRRAHQA